MDGKMQEQTQEHQVISLTENAAEKLKVIMKEGKEGGLRVNLFPGGCTGFQYDLDFDEKATESDIVIEQHGIKVFVEKAFKPFLDGTIIDYVETPEESGFVIDNPNVKRGCCGGKSGCS